MPRVVAPSRVSTIELFFDLVFVFTITQITSVLVEHPTWSGVAHAALELCVVFYMYGGFAWLTNTNKPDATSRRLILLAAMVAFFVVSMAAPRAFEDSGVTFAVGYAAVVVVHAVGFVVFGGRGVVRAVMGFLPWNVLAVALLLVAGFLHGDAKWAPWILAAVIQIGSPLVIPLSERFDVNAQHFGERHGLVILIVLGESLIGFAVATEHGRPTARIVAGALAGLLALIAMWWMYFGTGDDERAADAMEHTPAARRPIVALNAYFLAHYAMIFGILLLAAGAHLQGEDLLAEAETTTAWLIAAGAAVFALGAAVFRQTLHFAAPYSRLVVAAVCLATAPLGMASSTAAELCAVAFVLAAGIVVDSRSTTTSR